MEPTNLKILVIDDDTELLEVLEALLINRLPGATLLTADRGDRGLELARSEDPDVILMDLVMPGRTGYSICQALKSDERTHEIPVVFMTAHRTDRRSRAIAQESGAQGFLIKPFDEAELLVTVHTMARLRMAARQQRSEQDRLLALVDERTKALEDELTQRRSIEASLRVSEQRYRLIVEKSRDILFTLDRSGVFRYLSPAVASVLGFSADELLGTPFRQLIHPDDLAEVGRVLLRSFDEEYRSTGTEFRARHRSGEWRWLVARGEVTFDPVEGVPTFNGLANDMTERRRAEEELRASEERLRMALMAANQGIYDLHVPSGEATVSPEYATMLGYDPATFHETNDAFVERLHPDERDKIVDIYRKYVAGELPEYRVEIRQRMKDGSWKWILSMGRVVERDPTGAPIRMLGTHTDITETKKLERELRGRAKQLRSLTRRLQEVREEERREMALEIHDGLGHELTAVRMDIGLLERSISALGPQTQNTDIRGQFALLKELVDRAITTSRHLTTRLRPESLDRLGFGPAVEWLVQQWTTRTQIPCQVSIDPSLQTLGDPLAIVLFRVTQEGLTNIAKHARATSASIRLARELAGIVFEIADDGVGLPLGALSGATYGIIGIRERVETHGGTMSIGPHHGRGTVVRIELPASAAPPTPEEPWNVIGVESAMGVGGQRHEEDGGHRAGKERP
jgi:PAS domain S-box-containing protein